MLVSKTNDSDSKVIRIWTEFGSTDEINRVVENFVKKNYVNISSFYWVYAGQADSALV